jgi:AcrR family transcriptional regulator
MRFVPADLRIASRSQETRERLTRAAGEVFAARGYRGATMREIARRAGANLAAAHYHFGSKQDLYREVTRERFERLEARLEESGGAIADGIAASASRDQLIAQLRARVRTLLAMLLDPEEQHATLVLRDLIDPSEALPFMVRRWIDPMRRDTERILAALAPTLDAETVARCTRSVVGQVFFYRSHRAALLLMMGRRAYPRDFLDETTDHVVAFSLGGLAALERRRPPRARQRSRRTR